MVENISQATQGQAVLTPEQQLAQEKELLVKKYKARGIQNTSLKEYLELRNKHARRKKLLLPTPLKIAVITPLILIACFGAIFIPYTLYQVATTKPASQKSPKAKKADISLDDLMKKPAKQNPKK
jgi:hypothetical protein